MKWVLAGALALAAVGCTRPRDLRPEVADRSAGAAAVVPTGPAAVLAAARAVARDLELVEADAGPDWLVLHRPATTWSWGEVVGVYTEPAGDGTRVRVVSKRVLATNITAEDFTEPLLRGIVARAGEFGPQKNPWTGQMEDAWRAAPESQNTR